MGVELILVVVNLIVGFSCAIPITKVLGRMKRNTKRVFRYFAILIGIYFVECTFLVAGMGIPVFNLGLAFVWGIILAKWLRASAPTREVLKTSFFVSLYSSLPAFSFIIIPVMLWFGGSHILSVMEGTRFGIPECFPWPLNTILGFYAACAIGAPLFKAVITVGEVRWLIHRAEKSAFRKYNYRD